MSPLLTVVLNRSMNSGTRASSTRHTVWTAKEILRLSRLSTECSPANSSVYVYGVTLTFATSSSQPRPGDVGPRWTP